MDAGMDAGTEESLTSLAALYNQRLPPPRLAHALPAPAVLIRPAVQSFLYDHMFDPDNDHAWPLAPAGYRLRVLKMLLEVLEGAVGGDDEIIDPLMNSWSQLLVSQPKAVSDVEQVQKLGPVKYTAPAPTAPAVTTAETTTVETDKDEDQDPPCTVITSESPSLILSSGTTGFRTWEAALHLATYLATDRDAAQRFVRGKRVVELGAGTGLVALFLARCLEPSRVVATDREEGLVARLGEGALMNGIRGGVLSSRVLVWGEEVPGAWFGDGGGDEFVDTAVGADLIYDTDLIPPLVSTLILLFDKYYLKQFLISATLRNPDTFEAFLLACRKNHLAATPVPFESPPEDQQTGFFHSTAIPIRTFVISRSEHAHRRG